MTYEEIKKNMPEEYEYVSALSLCVAYIEEEIEFLLFSFYWDTNYDNNNWSFLDY